MFTESGNEIGSFDSVSEVLEDAGKSKTRQTVECFYTPIKMQSSCDSNAVNRSLYGYNLFSDLGIEATGKTIACCLTAYNESLEAYRTSLSSLAKCAEYFKSKGEERISREFVICIIVDGLEKMSKDFSDYAQRIGIYNPAELISSADFHMFESRIDRKLLETDAPSYGEPISENRESIFPVQCRSLQRVILFIKSQNRGKLDSHRCFFDTICRFYSASYFVQIDVGTSPNEDALYHMWKDLDNNPNVAATAARSHLPYPEKPSDILGIWQFFDIAIERIVNWPTEILMGNLSVLPGQLSLTRISSVTGHKEVENQNRNTGGVLNTYYRGLEDLNPFESNMYLAEDRILGLEMVFHESDVWELSYETDAEALVDSCETWGELCRQRRRWICSSMACRLSMLTKLPKIFRNSGRSWLERGHKLLATLYFLVYSILEWTAPASHFILQSTLTNVSLSLLHNDIAKSGIETFWILTVAALIFQLALSYYGKLNEFSEKIIRFSLNIQIVNILINVLIIFSLGNVMSGYFLFTTLALGMFSGYILLAYFYSQKLSIQILKNVVQYTVCRLPVKAFLMTYSIFNSHDTSWGTKGLDARPIDQDTQLKAHYTRFRTAAISIFLVSNILLYAIFYQIDWLNSIYTIAGMTAIICAQIVAAFFALSHVRFKNIDDKPL